jgi:hypothetical protein
MMFAVVVVAIECWAAVSSPFGFVVAGMLFGPLVGACLSGFREARDRPNYFSGAVAGGLIQTAGIGIIVLVYVLRRPPTLDALADATVALGVVAVIEPATGLIVGIALTIVQGAVSGLASPWRPSAPRACGLVEPGLRAERSRELFDP